MIKNSAAIVRSSKCLRTARARRVYGLRFCDFLKICKSADYYKFVEAMMIVEHHRAILRTPDENAKIGIVRSSHDYRRPNVTYALVIVVIDVRMSWALRPRDNLGRTEARPRLKVPFETLEKHEIESTMIESIVLKKKFLTPP